MNRIHLLSVFLLLFGISFTQESKPNSYVPFKSDSKWGFKKNGQELIPAKFEYITDFSMGLALVKENGKWGYIDTLGNWFIEAKYDKGQPFQDGYAYVKLNGKTGLLQLEFEILETFDEQGVQLSSVYNLTSFKTKIEAIYDNVKEDYNAYYLYSGKKMGYLKKDAEEEIVPAKYDTIVDYSEIVSGKNEDNTWDIYYKGKLIYEKAEEKIGSDSYNYYTKTINITKNGKVGLFHFEKGWIVPANYAWIDVIDFPAYYMGNAYSDKLYVLHDKDFRNYDPETWNEDEMGSRIDSITIIKIDGSKILNEKFNSIEKYYEPYSEIPSLFPLQAKKGNNLYNIYSNFSIKKLRFASVSPHYFETWFIGSTENMDYILDKNFNILDSFPKIEVYKETNYYPEGYYDEFGNLIYNEEMPYVEKEITEEPFLIAVRYNAKQEIEKAVYQLEERKLISPWMNVGENTLGVNRQDFNGNILYSYNLSNDKYGFYTKGMDKGTELKYTDLQIPIAGSCFVTSIYNQDSNTILYEIYKIEDKKLELISNKYQVQNSAETTIYGEYYEPLTGEIESNTKNAFIQNFFILRGENHKVGLITYAGKIIKPQFDSLVQNTSNDFFISTVNIDSLGNLIYGNVDLLSGKEIKPFYSNQFTFNNDLYVNSETFYYALPPDINDYYNYNEDRYMDYFEANKNNLYIALDGKQFKCRPERVYAKKVKHKYGLYGYSELTDKLSNVYEQVKPSYKMLEPSFISGVFCAKGSKGWGMINFVGDTILPLEYSSYDTYTYNGDGDYSLLVKQKKKLGIYDLKKGEIVPCRFDNLEILALGDYRYPEIIITRLNNKYGLFSMSGDELLAPTMDNISLQIDNNFLNYILFEKENKKMAIQVSQLDMKNKLELNHLKKYDFLANNEAYIKVGDEYEIYDISTNELARKIKASDIIKFGINYNICMQDGKFGVKDLQGKLMIPCEYDSLDFKDGVDSNVVIGVQKGVRYYIYVDSNQRYTEDQW